MCVPPHLSGKGLLRKLRKAVGTELGPVAGPGKEARSRERLQRKQDSPRRETPRELSRLQGGAGLR